MVTRTNSCLNQQRSIALSLARALIFSRTLTLTLFPLSTYVGGLSSLEIPAYRLPFDVVQFELKLMLDLGVKIEYNKALGHDGFTLQKLKDDGYEAVFIGIGLGAVRWHSVMLHCAALRYTARLRWGLLLW